MAETAYESAHRVYGGMELQYVVRVFIRADVRHLEGQGGISDSTSTSFVPNNADLYAQALIGDILQMGNEDMLVTGKSGPFIFVTRGYASTVAVAHQPTEACWVWREFTDRIGQRHALDAVSSIRRSFEANLGRYETSASDLKALNQDRFWDDLAFGTGTLTGFSSLRNRWVRFYILTRRGGNKVDHRAVGTMLLDDVKTDTSQTATVKLVGIGSLLRKSAEADRAKNGREWFVYVPTAHIVERLLASVDELRPGGPSPISDLPIHWKQDLRSMYGRTIALPAGQRAFSPFGKAESFRNLGAGHNFIYKSIDGPTSTGVAWSGGHPTALAWDPQVSGTWVKTGDPARAGRLYFGRGADIVEFDPVTMESAVAVEHLNAASAGNPYQIRRLWYNKWDPATAGKPKICGVAWTDYNDETLIGTTFSSRGVGARLFRWNGGTTLTTTRDYTNNTFWPGTHFFRFGKQITVGIGGQTPAASMFVGGIAGGGLAGDNIVIPFPQRIHSHSTVSFPTAAGAMVNLAGGGIGSFAGARSTAETGAILRSGFYLSGPQVVDGGTPPGTLHFYTDFYGVMHWNSTDKMNLRYTMGQQGACAFATDFDTQKAFILYCTLNTTDGKITVNIWDVHADTVTAVNTFGSDDDQPCSAAGVQVDGLANHFCVGRMLWKERTPASDEAYIDRYHWNGATWARTQIYASTGDADSTYNTPLWIERQKTNTGEACIVSWMQRNLAQTDMYGINSYNPSATISDADKKFLSISMLHAMVFDPLGINNFYGIGTDGVVVRGTIDTTGNGITALEPLDRGLPPVDGEHWSATEALVPDFAVSRLLYGVSSPTWPFGEDIRGNNEQTVTGPTDANRGLFVLWKHDTTITDIYEIGYFEDKTVEEALADLAFASDCVWGFDGDGRGNFLWRPRQQGGTALVTFDRYRGLHGLARSGGYQEVENQVEITPFIPRMGHVTAKIELTDKSPRKSGAPIEVEAVGISRRLVVMKCIRGGRVGQAAFSYYSQSGRYKTWLAKTYPSGVGTGTLHVFPQGRAVMGPYDDREVNLQHDAMQIPKGAQVFLPDGSVNAVHPSTGNPGGISLTIGGAQTLNITLETTWTPPRTFYAGTAVEIDLRFAQRDTGYVKTDADADGYDVLVSSYDWQEIGKYDLTVGNFWRTGVLIRFLEPTDDGLDINQREVAWTAGERIVIDVPGLEVVAQDASKIIAFDSDSIVKFGKKLMRGRQAVVSPRRAIHIANNRLAANKRPRYIYSVTTNLAPYLNLFDRVAISYPQMLRALDPETVTVRAVTHDLARAITTFEAIGSLHD